MTFLTIADAETAGAPACFSEEYAYLERTGGLPPYSGPVYPDHGSDAYDAYGGEPYHYMNETDPNGVIPPTTAEPRAWCPEGDDTACPTLTCGCPPF